MPMLQAARAGFARTTGGLLLAVSTLVIVPTAVRAQRTLVPSRLEVTGTSASATVTWQPVEGAVSYSVKRWKQDDLKCCNNSVEGLTTTTWTDNGPTREGFPQPGIYVFEVTAQLKETTSVVVTNWTLPPDAAVTAGAVLTPVGPPLAAVPLGSAVPATPSPPPAQPVAPQLILEPSSRQPAPAAAAPPTGISITGTPSTALVTWSHPAGNVSSFLVERWKQDAPDCCRNAVTGLAGAARGWYDAGFPLSGIYMYRVTAVYADGTHGSATATFTRPEPKNPTTIGVTRASPANLKLTWKPVGASYYMLWGAGLPDTGRRVSPDVCRVPPGYLAHLPGVDPRTCSQMVPVSADTGSWTLASFYEPGPVSTAASAFTKRTFVAPAPNTSPNTSPATPAPKYRVSITGFKVNHETQDDPLSFDGKGDEIFLSVVVLEPISLKPTVAWTARSKLVESKVFGDRNNAPDRIKAGSRSSEGGLQTGDVVALPAPFVVWDGPVTTPFLVIPTIWEADGPAILGIQSAWYGRMRPPSGSALNRWSQIYNLSSFEYPQIMARGLQYFVDAPCQGCFVGTADAQAHGTFQNPMVGYTRPIAVNMWAGNGFGQVFAPATISLSKANLAAYLGSNNSAELLVNYKDQSEGSGDYTLTLRFERIP